MLRGTFKTLRLFENRTRPPQHSQWCEFGGETICLLTNGRLRECLNSLYFLHTSPLLVKIQSRLPERHTESYPTTPQINLFHSQS